MIVSTSALRVALTLALDYPDDRSLAIALATTHSPATLPPGGGQSAARS